MLYSSSENYTNQNAWCWRKRQAHVSIFRFWNGLRHSIPKSSWLSRDLKNEPLARPDYINEIYLTEYKISRLGRFAFQQPKHQPSNCCKSRIFTSLKMELSKNKVVLIHNLKLLRWSIRRWWFSRKRIFIPFPPTTVCVSHHSPKRAGRMLLRLSILEVLHVKRVRSSVSCRKMIWNKGGGLCSLVVDSSERRLNLRGLLAIRLNIRDVLARFLIVMVPSPPVSPKESYDQN